MSNGARNRHVYSTSSRKLSGFFLRPWGCNFDGFFLVFENVAIDIFGYIAYGFKLVCHAEWGFGGGDRKAVGSVVDLKLSCGRCVGWIEKRVVVDDSFL